MIPFTYTAFMHIELWVRCNTHTTEFIHHNKWCHCKAFKFEKQKLISITDFFHHNKWYHCKAYILKRKKIFKSAVRLNETAFLSTQNIKTWLQIWLKFCKRLHKFHKSNNPTIKLISLQHTLNASTKTLIVGTQKYRLNEQFFLSPKIE